jgi:hypothetical protein
MAVHCVCWNSVGKTMGIPLYIVQENCAACFRTHWKIPLDLLENVEKFHLRSRYLFLTFSAKFRQTFWNPTKFTELMVF